MFSGEVEGESDSDSEYDFNIIKNNNNDFSTSIDNTYSLTTTNSFSSFQKSKNIKLILSHNEKKKIHYKTIFFVICFFIFLNFIFILSNISLFITYIYQHVHIHLSNNHIENYQLYEMLYYQKYENRTIRKIVDLSLTFEIDDFYHFENENGNGIIIKIDNNERKGDEYEICADVCQCYIKENGKRKRRMANVIMVPIGICVFGVFSTMYQAMEYGKQYYMDKCEDECPSEVRYIDVETVTKKMDEKYKEYECSGYCKANIKDFNRQIKKKYNEWKYDIMISWSYNRETYLPILDKLSKHNEGLLKELCEAKNIVKSIVSENDKEAVALFNPQGQVECQKVRHFWHFAIKEEDILSYIHELGSFINVCDIDTSKTFCLSNI